MRCVFVYDFIGMSDAVTAKHVQCTGLGKIMWKDVDGCMEEPKNVISEYTTFEQKYYCGDKCKCKVFF